MATGARDLSLITTLVGWDADALNNFRLEDKTTYAAVAAALNTALTALFFVFILLPPNYYVLIFY